MKKRIRLTPLQFLISCGLLLLLSFFTCLLAHHENKKDEETFRQFCQDLFVQEMNANVISLHYGLARPETFGISDYPVRLPCYEPGSELRSSEYPELLLEKLSSFQKEDLSLEDQYSFSCLERTLQLSKELASYPYFADPLSPTQGMQCELPILLSEYSFRTKRDVEEYLQLLSQTRAYFSSLLTYEREKSSAGLSPSSVSLRKVAQQCDDIVTLEELEQGEHFLQKSFEERLAELSASVALSSGELADFTSRNNALLQDVLLPGFQDLKAGILELAKNSPENPCGLSAFPGGKSYYACLLASQTGSSKTPEEVKALLETVLAKELENVRFLIAKYPECVVLEERRPYLDYGINDASVILEDLKQRMSSDFPVLDVDCSVTVKTVSPSLQKHSAPAFYLTAPIDATDQNVIYVNPASDSQGLDLYVTLAHEGYPGHLYQNAYRASNLLSLENPFPRMLTNYGGYLEGWALYVEQISYDYAAQLLTEQGKGADAACVLLEKHYRSLQLCLYSLLDVMIHYENAGTKELLETMAPFHPSEESLKALYDYICDSPCNYLKYYLGYLEILELQRQAALSWGDSYSNLSFHRFLLDSGPADFENLRQRLERESKSQDKTN